MEATITSTCERCLQNRNTQAFNSQVFAMEPSRDTPFEELDLGEAESQTCLRLPDPVSTDPGPGGFEEASRLASQWGKTSLRVWNESNVSFSAVRSRWPRDASARGLRAVTCGRHPQVVALEMFLIYCVWQDMPVPNVLRRMPFFTCGSK